MKTVRALAWSIPAALFGFVFYYFLALPLILEYSLAGVLIATGLAIALLYGLPRGKRLPTLALVLAFLLTLEALGRISEEPAALRLAVAAVLLLGYPLLARLATGLPWRLSLPVVLMAVLLAGTLSPALYPALTGFSPQWVSPPFRGQTKIPFFTPVVADLDGDGKAEIAAVTSDPPRASATTLLTAFRFEYRVFRWNGSRVVPVDPGSLSAAAKSKLASFARNEHPAMPALTTAWSTAPDGLPMFTFRPAVDPFAAAAAADPARLPFATLGLTLREVEAAHSSWAAMEQGYGNAADQPGMNGLASNREVLLVNRELDVTGDGRPDRLVNRPDQGAHIEGAPGAPPLWEAPNASFRFEDAGRVGDSPDTVILAQDKGAWGLDPSRFLGAYRLEGNRMVRLWKVFVPGIVNPVLADVDGDGRNEVVATMYGRQRVIVLKKHALPVVGAAWALTLGLILWPRGRRFLGTARPASRLLVPAAALLVAAVTVAAASRLPSPARTLASGEPPAPVDAGAQPDPGAALAVSQAVLRMEGVRRYSFQGESLTYVGERRLQATFGGMVAEGRQMRAFASIWGDTYEAYRNGNQIYLGRRVWYPQTVSGPELPPSPSVSLSYLEDMAGTARSLPGTELVVRDVCRVYVLYPDAETVKKLIPAALAPSASFWDTGRVPGQFVVKVWVGEKDGLIHQLQTVFDLPLQEASGLRQKTLITLWNFNSPDVVVKPPDGVPDGDGR